MTSMAIATSTRRTDSSGWWLMPPGLRRKSMAIGARLAITAASNGTGWLPPIDAIIAAAHQRGIPVALDAAQLAPHRPLPAAADYLAFSGHKLYAPFGSGALVGARIGWNSLPFNRFELSISTPVLARCR